MIKRLLCIISSLNVGGAETFLMKLYRGLDKSKYQMDFVVNADGFYDKEVFELGGKIFKLPLRTKHPLKSYFGLKEIVKKNHYDYVLKLGDSPLSAVDLLAAKSGGAKARVVRSCNALTNLSTKKKIIDSVFRPVLNSVSTVKIAPSDLAAKYTFGEKQFKGGKVHLLNNGVDLDVYRYDKINRKSIRAELGIEDKLVIGHIGRFNKQKNHKFLIEIFNELQKIRDDAVLLLVGKGELEDEIKTKIKSLGIEDKVIFTGVRSDISAMLSAMDVFVFPSFHEGMPNTVIEAQATGLPCVISDTITKEADITGLVEYLSLSMSAAEWAEKALANVSAERMDTHQKFIDKGYDIQSVVDKFVELCFEEKLK